MKKVGNEMLVDCMDLVGGIADFTLSCFGLPSVFDNTKKIISIGEKIYDEKLIANLLLFLKGCDFENVKQKEKMRKFFDKKVNNPERFEGNGEKLLDYLSKINDKNSAILVGKGFLYCVQNNINSDIFLKFSYNVRKSYYDDLKAIELFKHKKQLLSSEDERLENLYQYGFLFNCGINGGGASEDSPSGWIYELNEFGEILLALI